MHSRFIVMRTALFIKEVFPRIMTTRHLHKNPFLKTEAYINGKWVSAKSGKTFQVINPSNGTVICDVADCSSEDVEVAVQAAQSAFQSYQSTTAKERAGLLKKLFELHMKNQNELASLMTEENGKTLTEAKGEIAYGASFLEWFAEEARRVYGDVVPPPVKGREMIFIRQPIGIVAIITPWNFPNAMITRKIAAALAVGCTCIIKPAEDTPLSALAVAHLAEEAGFPPGAINVLPASRNSASSVGTALCKHPSISALSFTGSTAVGKILLEQCASTVKKVSLELGGNAPFIVFDSANVEKAVLGVIACKFRNTGQTCVSANRILVQEGIHDRFVARLKEEMQKKLVVGDGFAASSTVGPLINEKAVDKVKEHVQDAVTKGGNIVLGGKQPELGQNFFEPTLVTGATTDMKFCNEETFGPFAAILKFKTEEEALRIANSSRVGLAGYFFSENISQVWRVAKRLEVGMVGVNEGIISAAEGAFGGIKESGLGREGSRYGIEEFVEMKYICFGGLD